MAAKKYKYIEGGRKGLKPYITEEEYKRLEKNSVQCTLYLVVLYSSITYQARDSKDPNNIEKLQK